MSHKGSLAALLEHLVAFIVVNSHNVPYTLNFKRLLMAINVYTADFILVTTRLVQVLGMEVLSPIVTQDFRYRDNKAPLAVVLNQNVVFEGIKVGKTYVLQSSLSGTNSFVRL